jgi:hypothetical protein
MLEPFSFINPATVVNAFALTLNPLPERERDFQSGSPSPVLGEGVGG